MTTYVEIPTLGFRVGDSVRLRTESNRIRRVVKEIPSLTRMILDTFIRPSKGYARHVRRTKSLRTVAGQQ